MEERGSKSDKTPGSVMDQSCLATEAVSLGEGIRAGNTRDGTWQEVWGVFVPSPAGIYQLLEPLSFSKGTEPVS